MGGTTTADIANTENSLNEILLSYYMERGIPSIARDALNITNMVGHTNFFFTIQPKSDDTGIEIVKRGITAQETPVKSVSVTLEALQDMFSVHGLDGIKLIANFLRDKANAEENQTFINFLSSNALVKNPLTFTEPQNSELIHFELSKRIQQYVFEMNMKHQRTFEAFAIVPYITCGAVSGLDYINSIVSDQQHKLDNTPIISTYRVAREILTDYYINPDINDDYVYVALRSRLNPACSCGIFGAYQESIRTAVAYETAEQKIFLFNRYGIVLNPAHSQNDPMIIKFKLNNL
jgi:hypothetical protein